MKKLRLLLALFVASIGALQSASARVAPTLPEAKTVEGGKDYYLYNVMEDKFACVSTTNSYYVGLGTYGDKINLYATDLEGEYSIKWAKDNYAWFGYDSYIKKSSQYYDYLDCYMFAESTKGYTIQRSPRNKDYYKSDEYVGYDGSNGDRLSPALSEGSIHWKLFSVEDAEHYFAKHKLYTLLNVADQYNFYITQYELVYDNPNSTTAELDLAQATLENALDMSNNYVSPSWSEYPILFQNTTENKWRLTNYNKYFEWCASTSGQQTTSTLKATVNVDNDATLVFSFQGNSYSTLRFYLDGEMVETVQPNIASKEYRRYYVELTPGKHDISWECLLNYGGGDSNYFYHHLKEIGLVNTPTITPATTITEGQLGTEVLKLVDPVSSVKKIVINGIIGSEDWTTIGLMVNAFSIDMSGATATTAMPDYMFQKEKFPFLHNVILPQGLTAIGDRAFYESDVDNEITFPETLESIGVYAFCHSKIKAAHFPEGFKSLGSYSFSSCYYLKNVSLPTTVKTIPYQTFSGCENLRTFTIPEGVEEIEAYSFDGCKQFNARFPSTVTEIEDYAFRNTATDSLFVTENMSLSDGSFSYCNSLVYAEFPTILTNFGHASDSPLRNCYNLNKVKLMSPTIVTHSSYGRLFDGINKGNITLQVPDFLESAYKLDPYWYECKVKGFSSAEIKDWILAKNLTLNPGQRFGGEPNIDMRWRSTLTINGDDAQTLNNLYLARDWYWSGNWNTQVLSNTNSVNIGGTLTYRAYTPEKVWVFMCLPFDTKVGDIVCESSYAIRYYDGAQRASNGTGGNWKNYSADDIIPAGTGFILQTSKQCSTWFKAQENASKQYVVSNNEFVKALDANPSDVTANKGWNLVGNPWVSYYNIHKLNFTAPITVWNGNEYNPNYEAYSIIDDDYAIKPSEAIFVQCPDEINSISFPIDGRQLTSEIESQSGARLSTPSERKLIDVELSDGNMSDKTRFVLNPQASLDYELSCDASKFFSLDTNVPQIYTIEAGTQLAINERPVADGTVQLGIRVAQGGTYTISAPRNGFRNIVLMDNETGTETDLANGNYTFNADQGTNDNRFTLRVGGVVITGVQAVTAESGQEQYYNLQGQRIAAPQKGLYIVNGKKIMK